MSTKQTAGVGQTIGGCLVLLVVAGLVVGGCTAALMYVTGDSDSPTATARPTATVQPRATSVRSAPARSTAAPRPTARPPVRPQFTATPVAPRVACPTAREQAYFVAMGSGLAGLGSDLTSFGSVADQPDLAARHIAPSSSASARCWRWMSQHL